jgi:hypothetical protein
MPPDLLRRSFCAMAVFGALCHFCERHGPCVVMMSQCVREERRVPATALLLNCDSAAPVPELFGAAALMQDIRNSPRWGFSLPFRVLGFLLGVYMLVWLTYYPPPPPNNCTVPVQYNGPQQPWGNSDTFCLCFTMLIAKFFKDKC